MKIATKLFLGVALAGLTASTGALAQDAADWGGLSAYVAVTSDYRFRGVSQNDREVTPQASINWTGPDGFYAGTWLSKINLLDGSSYEADFYAGKHFDLAGYADLNVEAYYYSYPDHNSALAGYTNSYYETIVQLSHSFGPLTLTASGANSPDFFAGTGAAWWVGGTASYALTDWLSLSGNVGHQWVNHTLPAYTHWDLGLTATYKSLAFDVRYIDTDLGSGPGGSCVAYTAGKPSWCQAGVMASLTYNISAFPW